MKVKEENVQKRRDNQKQQEGQIERNRREEKLEQEKEARYQKKEEVIKTVDDKMTEEKRGSIKADIAIKNRDEQPPTATPASAA